MRILHAVINQTNKGTYWRAFNLGRHLSKRDYQIFLLSTSPSNRFGIQTYEKEGINGIESPDFFLGSLRSGWDPWNTINRINWARNQKFDLVHIFESRPTVLFSGLYIKKQQGIPIVMDWADWFGRGGSVEERPNPIIRTLLRPIETFFEERFKNHADGITSISTTLYKKALDLSIPGEKILLLPNGSAPNRFPLLDKKTIRLEMGFNLEIPIIGYVGTIFHQDAELMATSFNIILQQYPYARLFIVGYCPINIQSLVDKPSAVKQTGPVNTATMHALLACSDLFWLPMRDSNANRARLPLKLHDYMSMARPIIVTNVGDAGRIVAEDGIGLISPDDPYSFADQTLKLLSDSNLRERMGNHARYLAETRYSWSRMVDKLEVFYNQIAYKNTKVYGSNSSV